MDIQSTAFSSELVKIARKKSEKQNYGKAMVTLAPAAAMQATADFPRGWIDQYTKLKINPEGLGVGSTGSHSKVDKNLGALVPRKRQASPLRRGVARTTGRLGAALVTTPMFLSGIKDIKDAKTKEDKQRGYAKVIGSGAVYSAGKGGVEESIAGGLKAGLQKVKSVAQVRGIIGAAAAAGTAATIAKNMKKSEKSKSFKDRVAAPLAAGAAIGGLKGGAEYSWVERSAIRSKLKTPRGIAGSVAGRAAAGALGALALSEIATKYMDKTSGVIAANAQFIAKDRMARRGEGDQPGSSFDLHNVRPAVANARVTQAINNAPAAFIRADVGPKPGELYYDILKWSSANNTTEIQNAYEALISKGNPEATPTRRARYYALHDSLSARGMQLPATQMRDQVHPPVKAPGMLDIAAVGAIIAAPYVVWGAINKMSVTDKDLVMRDALDNMTEARGVQQYTSPPGSAVLERTGFTPTNYQVQNPHTGAYKNIPGEAPFITMRQGAAPELHAHELGHATSTLWRHGTDAAMKAYQYGRVAAITLPLVALGLGYDQSFATPEELEARAKFSKAVGVVAGAAMAPRLVEEGIASAKAMKYLMEADMRVTPPTLRHGLPMSRRAAESAAKETAAKGILRTLGRGAKKLLPAFGMYAAPAVTPFLVAKLLQDRADRARGRR